jgi:hypothetical protein
MQRISWQSTTKSKLEIEQKKDGPLALNANFNTHGLLPSVPQTMSNSNTSISISLEPLEIATCSRLPSAVWNPMGHRATSLVDPTATRYDRIL